MDQFILRKLIYIDLLMMLAGRAAEVQNVSLNVSQWSDKVKTPQPTMEAGRMVGNVKDSECAENIEYRSHHFHFDSTFLPSLLVALAAARTFAECKIIVD